MKSITLSLLFGCLFLSFSYAQPTQLIKADSLLSTGDLDEAVEEYRILLKENPRDHHLNYNLACTWSLKQQRDSAFHYLFLATEKDTSVSPLTDPDLYFLLTDQRWKQLEDQLVERVEAKYGQYKKEELARELWSMRMKDQAFYYHLDVAEKKLGWGSPVVGAIWELKSKINEEIVDRLEEIIEEHGWPKQSDVGGNAASAAFLVIQHADIEVQKKYLPMMREAADAGEASWRSLALLIDRVNLREGKEQIYGSQVYRNEDGSFYVKDLKEPEYVNQRRAEVGLGPIQEYVNRWGIEWTIEQKEK